MPERILLIEDDPDFRTMLLQALKSKGYEVVAATSAEDGVRALGKEPFDLVLTDVKLPGMTGVEAIPALKNAAPDVDVIVMTAYASRETALEAVRGGAYDFFSKPFSLAEMEVVIRRALEKRRLQAEVRSLRRAVRASGPAQRMVGDSEPMRQVLALIEKIAPLDSTVLVTGESGTGKELAAETLHMLSPRADKPLVRINCAAIPENLLESELFGHEKGAFTGALNAKTGLFETAHGGTIFLDEIGEMPLALQAKILRVVEYKQVTRVGANAPRDVDVRIVAATNRDLLARSADGQFREDLYYRLNVATVHMPALRERMDDVPHLAEFFLDKINAKLDTAFLGVSGDALHALMAEPWPGNVRQLANVMERAAILGQSEFLTAADVRAALSREMRLVQVPVQGEGGSLKATLAAIEKSLILSALDKASGKQTEAARLLGISAKNLWNKLQKHGITGR